MVLISYYCVSVLDSYNIRLHSSAKIASAVFSALLVMLSDLEAIYRLKSLNCFYNFSFIYHFNVFFIVLSNALI